LIADGGNLLQALAATDVSKDLSAADRAIRVRLTAELKAQPWASMLAKNVVVANGVVHLFGFGRSDEERGALRPRRERAWRCPGRG
jgi:hypothetical protein